MRNRTPTEPTFGELLDDQWHRYVVVIREGQPSQRFRDGVRQERGDE